ncbi:hypothetical protein ACJMK2_027614 [Sinanodonta woodiana]|uniref:BACK domain-containing protein n=1 Tax=Sinanodonta woodiana TaxID=1069815 RepID=A0ABD3X6C9_SINWO
MFQVKEMARYPQEVCFLKNDNPVLKERIYIQNLPEGDRRKLAKFLSDGCPADLQLSEENFHSFLHLCLLRTFSTDNKLMQHCMNFYKDVEESDHLYILQGCAECKHMLKKNGSKMICPDPNISKNSISVQYGVLFVQNDAIENQTVIIVELSSNKIIYKQCVKKVNKFGRGFSVCSQIRNECPYIFISGGRGRSSRKLLEYDVIENKWRACPKLCCERFNHSMVAVDENIYLIGGEKLSLIEKYNPKTKLYSSIGHLEENISNPLVIQYQQCLYIFGGKASDGRDVPCVRCLNTITNITERLPDLPLSFSGGQAVLLDTSVYMATPGGNLIWFDPKSGLSKLCSCMTPPRELFFIFDRGSRICVLGGIDGTENKYIQRLDRYYPEQNCWKTESELKPILPIVASCILQYPRKCPVLPFNKSI